MQIFCEWDASASVIWPSIHVLVSEADGNVRRNGHKTAVSKNYCIFWRIFDIKAFKIYPEKFILVKKVVQEGLLNRRKMNQNLFPMKNV